MVEHLTHLREVKGSSPDTVAGSLVNGIDVTISNKRRYRYNTHSANSHSITIKHLTNHPKVLDSRPDSATGSLANGTDVTIFIKRRYP